MEKLPQIQVARAIAALMVVFFHSYMGLRSFHDGAKVDLYSWGFLGVNFFFAISGFIISLVLDRPNASVKTFFIKRFIRIYPLYWLFIIAAFVSALGFGVFQGSQDMTPPSILKNLLILPIQGAPLYAVGWSLEHEVLFYVLAGLLFKLRSMWWLFAATATLGILGVVNPSWGEHLFAGAHLDFSVGILVYLLRHRIRKLGVAIPLVVAVNGFVLTTFEVPFSVLPAEAGLLIALLNLSPEVVTRYMSPLVRIGDVSYSLYLGHWLLLAPAAAAGAALNLPDEAAEPFRLAYVLASVGFANLLYEVVEKPFLRLGHRLSGGAPGKAAAALPASEVNPPTASRPILAVFLGLASLLCLLCVLQVRRFASLERGLPALTMLSLQLEKLPKKLESHRPFSLQDLRGAGVDVPGTLVADEKLVTPWNGILSISKLGGTTYIDLQGLPRSACAELLQKAHLIPRVSRAAATGMATDERAVPIDPKQAKKDSRRSTFVRLIRTD